MFGRHVAKYFFGTGDSLGDFYQCTTMKLCHARFNRSLLDFSGWPGGSHEATNFLIHRHHFKQPGPSIITLLETIGTTTGSVNRSTFAFVQQLFHFFKRLW